MRNREPAKPFDLDLAYLLHPAGAFNHPRDVLDDPDMTTHEKRAILAAWASDACALEAVPALRRSPPGSPSRRLRKCPAQPPACVSSP